ncbi:MAG TPA: methyltransferase domain-containing protein, partial [Kiloniellaceae bacterium]|nr:methyltransferase domain-containing protein [Kiloniellaceae bacterium]
LGLRGAALAGNPGAVAMIRHHRLLYGDLADPLALLRGEAPPTQIGRYWTYVEGTGQDEPAPDAVQAYSDLMAVSQAMIAEAVTRDFPFRRYRRILDVGGGTGTFLEHVARAAPAAALTLFDLPQVATAAADRMARKGLGERLRCIGGDFTADPLPRGHDLITLVRVVYDHDDAKVLRLLKACRAALDERGNLLIAEPMSGRRAGARIADAYFSFYLLAMGPGDIRSPDAHGALLRQAGFSRITALPGPMPDLARLILARP